jgi:hypothetical protein
MAAPRKKSGLQLSPPQFTYFNEVKFSVGNDPLVRVDPLREVSEGVFEITLHVRGFQKAKALATLLVLNKTIGSIRIRVIVRTTQGTVVEPIRRALTPQEIARLFTIAFRTNRLFDFAATRMIFGRTHVFPVFKVRIIQFFNDDLSDFFRNFNNVAAFVFRDVLRNTISGTPIDFSTAQKKNK